MAQMVGDSTLWKTVVLTEDKKTDAVAIMSKWEEFLGINLITELDQYTHVAVFSNNTQLTYMANIMLWTNINGSFFRAYVRSNFASANINNGSNYANAGTTVSIYKLRHI